MSWEPLAKKMLLLSGLTTATQLEPPREGMIVALQRKARALSSVGKLSTRALTRR